MKGLLPICVLFLAGCATVKAPEGGDKDIRAPKAESIVPANESTNFSSSLVVFEFDEFFKLDNPRRQVLVSPPMDPAPEFKVKGKNLLMTLEAPLQPNTTYSIFFAGAIKDYNEGNDTSFAYVFSTGAYLDSLVLGAWVKDAFSGEPVKDVWLLAYKEGTDSLIDFKTPQYIARTNKEGVGLLRNLPDEKFHLFALEDINYNLMYDLPNERLAFKEALVSPHDQEDIVLDLFAERDPELKVIEKIYEHPGKITLTLTNPVSPVEMLDTSRWPVRSAEVNDSVIVYLKDKEVVKGIHKLVYDIGEEPDTANVYISDNLEPEVRKVTVHGGSDVDHDRSIGLVMSRPITKVDTSKITLLKDSVPVTWELEDRRVGMPEHVHIKADLSPGSTYELVMDRGAINCQYGIVSDSARFVLKTRAQGHYAKLALSIKGPQVGVVELLKNKEVVRRMPLNSTLLFDRLAPGKYNIRLIHDLDENGEWSTGSYADKRQPEQVLHYPDKIEIKSGWDVEEVWEIPNESLRQ